MATRNKQDGGVKSGETMFAVVDALIEKDGATVTELADHLNIAKSTVHRHLTTLKERRYVVQEENEYRVGLQFLNVGIYTRNQYPLYEVASQKINELAETTGEQVWCLVEEDGKGFYIAGASGKHHAAATQVGKWTHLHQPSCGKALLSHLPDERIEEIVAQHGLPAETENTITEESHLWEEIEEIRKRGVAFNREESVLRLNAVGAPIRHNQTGEVMGSISVSGPAHRLKGEKLEQEIPDKLLGLTNEIEINLSYASEK
jgi:DNA-binding IclR family transcriptional regulator